MIATTQHQSLLFFTPLAQQITLLKDDLLDPVDHLLDDQELVDRVRVCLIGRHPNSYRTGRPGIAPDRLLRCRLRLRARIWGLPSDSLNSSRISWRLILRRCSRLRHSTR